ncbi:MAG: glycosyltransferase [Verrucomicrobia bacterium]|nr:glycosyltransferase [Verrucomicrobiota bacterium]MDA1069300.1 glycosyltransferase [Verrucomicrobiota bacterium]
MNQFLRPFVFSVSVLVFLGFTLAAGLTDSLAEDASSLIIYYIGMAITGTLVWAFFPDLRNPKKSVFIIVGLAVISRLLMAGFPTSDDVNRYLWEGKLLLEGESPYSMNADDPAREQYRDRFWEGMNHRDKTTAYPPLSLAVFAGLNLVSYNLWIYKLFFGLMDLAALGIIIRILNTRNLPLRNSLIYALSPLTIISFSGEAHFDSLFIFLTLSSLYLFEKDKTSLAWIILGLSIQIKIISVLLIPLLFWKKRSVKALWIVVPLALLSLLFLNDFPNLINGILHYGGSMSHNGSLNHLFIDYLGSRESASKLSALILMVVVLVVTIRIKDVLKGSFIIFGSLILLSPTVHYWYLTWALPFVVFFPTLPWLFLLALSAFYFSAWAQFGKSGEWYQPMTYLRIQWIPFYILWVPLFLRSLRKLLHKPITEKTNTLSVVIPTLNEGAHLNTCLSSIEQSSITVDEIIIVDGGSTDDTRSMVKGNRVQLLKSEMGRGYQIAKGVAHSNSDVILVLHADAQISPGALEKMMHTLKLNPEIVGGAIGQRFMNTKPKPVLLLVEALNDLRALWQENSFGDQGQFFRRSTIERLGGFPSIPLMEDVELTALLKKEGDLALLDCDIVCSARRWEKDKASSRFLQVLSLVIRYKVLKLFGRDPSKQLFKEYYSR